MAHLTVLTLPDHRLRIKATPVDVIDNLVRKNLNDMAETMYADRGIGLAATQVNIHKRMLVMNIPNRDDDCENTPQSPNVETLIKIVNPRIVWASEESVTENEGCLSLPELSIPVTRAAQVRIAYSDENGNPHELDADGLLARCIQHEMDHLDGKLALDYLSPLKRELALKKLEKIKRYQDV